MGSTREPEVTAILVEVGPMSIFHPVMFRGEQYFLLVQDIHTTTDQIVVLETVMDGFCAYDSLIQGQRGTNYHKSAHKAEINILKNLMMDECERWIASLALCKVVIGRPTLSLNP